MRVNFDVLVFVHSRGGGTPDKRISERSMLLEFLQIVEGGRPL